MSLDKFLDTTEPIGVRICQQNLYHIGWLHKIRGGYKFIEQCRGTEFKVIYTLDRKSINGVVDHDTAITYNKLVGDYAS
jgi:hypothetical protein